MRAENWMKAGCVALLPSVEVAMIGIYFSRCYPEKIFQRLAAILDFRRRGTILRSIYVLSHIS